MFRTYLIEPLYNMFIYLIGIMPGGDVGLAIIALTLMVRILFYPAFAASIRTQMGMQAIQSDVDEICLLSYLHEDPETEVILMYIEELKNAQDFIKVAREITA